LIAAVNLVYLGLAFQLIDDTLDYSTESLKDQELDLQNGIVNAVVFEALSENSELMTRFKKGEDLSLILKGVDMTSAVKKISDEATLHLTLASDELAELKVYLADSLYKNDSEALEHALEHLHLVISYMALRQN
jgi:geranylgeranyl pyrophosphate synthase